MGVNVAHYTMIVKGETSTFVTFDAAAKTDPKVDKSYPWLTKGSPDDETRRDDSAFGHA